MCGCHLMVQVIRNGLGNSLTSHSKTINADQICPLLCICVCLQICTQCAHYECNHRALTLPPLPLINSGHPIDRQKPSPVSAQFHLCHNNTVIRPWTGNAASFAIPCGVEKKITSVVVYLECLYSVTPLRRPPPPFLRTTPSFPSTWYNI